MKNLKNKRTTILAVILIGLLFVAYKVMFVVPPEEVEFDENIAASQRVEGILLQVESINFDTNVVNDSIFGALRSIETPLISLPVGKANPFSASGN